MKVNLSRLVRVYLVVVYWYRGAPHRSPILRVVVRSENTVVGRLCCRLSAVFDSSRDVHQKELVKTAIYGVLTARLFVHLGNTGLRLKMDGYLFQNIKYRQLSQPIRPVK